MAFVALAGAGRLVADDIDGEWTGRLRLNGNYYWETSTRVVAPEFGVSLTSPKGTDLDVNYLVDVITSASQAAGATTDVRFNETRHDITLGVGRELELDESQLRWNVGVHFSREPDYTSVSGTVGAAVSFHDRATTLRLNLTYLHDEVRQNFRGSGAAAMGGTALVPLNDDFDAIALSVGWDQIVRPWLMVELGYDLAWLNGFLANAYRRVIVAGAAVAERHPRTRHRHTISARVKARIVATGTTLQLRYRTYVDSWEIGALNPEVRVYQRLTRHLTLRARYRYFRQTESFFYEEDDEAYAANAPFVTNDPKMSAFRSHELGLSLRLDFGFLAGTSLESLEGARLDLSVNYAWRTISFGDSVTAQAGLSVPF